jgi:hypothetical protein
VHIQARIVGRSEERLGLKLIDPAAVDQPVGGPVLDDRGSLLGVIVSAATTNTDGDLELTVEPIHHAMGIKRMQTPIGAK